MSSLLHSKVEPYDEYAVPKLPRFRNPWKSMYEDYEEVEDYEECEDYQETDDYDALSESGTLPEKVWSPYSIKRANVTGNYGQ